MIKTIRKTISIVSIAILLVVPQIATSLDFEINFDDLEGVETSIGDFNEFLDDLNGYDFDDLLGDVGGDNDLLSCLMDGANLGDILKGTDLADGICGLLNVGDGFSLDNVLDNPMAKCFGVGINNPFKETTDLLKNLCESSSASAEDDTTYDEENDWEADTTSGGGDSSNTPKNSGNYRELSSDSLITAGTTESGGVNGGISVDGDKEKKIEERKYPNKLTMETVYKTDGGLIFKKAKESPNGAEANAIKKNRKEALILIDIASKVRPEGNLDSSNIHLPKTPLDVMKKEEGSANFNSLVIVDILSFQNYLISKAREKYVKIKKETLKDYYKEEKKEWAKVLKEEKDYILLQKKTAFEALSAKYTLLLKKEWERPDYMFDISQNIEKITKIEYRDTLKVNALMQMNRETIIKSKMAEEKRNINFKIESAMEQAYFISSIYRKDIAKKEIDNLLKAVDTNIQ